MENKDNYTTLIGRTRWAPNVHHFGEKNRSVTRFTLVVVDPDREFDRGGHFQITVWDDQLQPMAARFLEGTKVHVEGRLCQDSWKDKDSGEWVRKVHVIADRLTDLSAAPAASQPGPDVDPATGEISTGRPAAADAPPADEPAGKSRKKAA